MGADPAGDGLVIEPMTDADGAAVLEIFRQGIATGVATFDAIVPEWRAWTASHRRDCRLVARLDGQVVGWTAVARYSSRDVYSGVAWESVYVGAAARGHGVGGALLAALLRAAETGGIWTLIAGVQVNNAASLALHERADFRRIGFQERVGRDISGVWRDVILFEWRSPISPP